MLTEDGSEYSQIPRDDKIALTARLDLERSGLRSSTSVITEQEAKICARGNIDNPGERGAGQIIPGEESGAGRVITGMDTLHR